MKAEIFYYLNTVMPISVRLGPMSDVMTMSALLPCIIRPISIHFAVEVDQSAFRCMKHGLIGTSLKFGPIRIPFQVELNQFCVPRKADGIISILWRGGRMSQQFVEVRPRTVPQDSLEVKPICILFSLVVRLTGTKHLSSWCLDQ
jgi:hypothetical protein